MALRRVVLGLLLGSTLSGCALSQGFGPTPVAPSAAREADPDQLVGRWEGEVDLTFPDRTLVIRSVRHQGAKWAADVEYGTTGVYLTPLPATVEAADGRLTLRFATQLASTITLDLVDNDILRGALKLPNDPKPRSMELKRVSSNPGAPSTPPSTLLDRLSRTAAGAERPAAERVAALAFSPPLALPANLPTALPPLIFGRWEGDLDFAVSRRVLVIDSARFEAGKWWVEGRYGVTDADLAPVHVLVETADGKIALRFVTTLASRVTLTLHEDGTLRGGFRLAFEAKERRLELKRVATAATTPGADRPEALAVQFRYPIDQLRVGEPALMATAIVTSSRGVATISVTLNGSEIHQQTERGTPKSVVVSVPVTLREGPNVIAITATEADRTTRQEVRTVIYDRRLAAVPATPAPGPGVTGAPSRERWAVVIGAARYDNKAIPPLAYSVADAEAVYQTLVGPGGFRKENVLLLTDTTERKPTLRNIRYALGTFLARSARRDDMVLIFFAGHGGPEADLRGTERDGLAKYLIPIDADPDDLYATALPMDEIRTIFERIEAERVVAFFDTCYSGAAGGRTFAARRMRDVRVDDVFLDRVAQAKGRVVITASRASEVSVELQELGHGLFTYYLVQGLRGAADANSDGIVSLQELYAYVEREVSRKSRAVGGNQHPVMKGEIEGSLPLMPVKR